METTTTCERCERLARINAKLLDACDRLCHRLEVNELVNQPDNPCNAYDQPDYDFAVAVIAEAEAADAE